MRQLEPILDIKAALLLNLLLYLWYHMILQQTTRVETLALTDILTSLAKRHIQKLIPDLHISTKPCLFILDIDGFATINDFYGHEMGDFILKTLANNLLGYAGEEAHVYRYPRWSFVLLSNTLSHDAFLEFIERIIRKSEAFEYHYNDATLSIKLSAALSFEPKEHHAKCWHHFSWA